MKKTGKALSLVLSMALVVSSLATTFASASTKSETGTVNYSTSTFYLSNGGSSDTLKADITSKVDSNNISSFKLSDGSAVTTYDLKDVVISSGTSIASVSTTKVDGVVTDAILKLASSSVSGTVTVAARYQGTVVRGTDSTDTTVYATKTLTFNVLKNNTVYVLASKDLDTNHQAKDYVGLKPDSLGSLAKSVGDTEHGSVYVVTPATGSAFATWTAQTVNTKEPTVAESALKSTYSVISSSTPVAVSATEGEYTFTLTSKYTGSSANSGSAYATVGSYTITAQQYELNSDKTLAVKTGSTTSDKGTASVKVANRVIAYSATGHVNDTISAFGGITYLYSDTISSSTALSDAKTATQANAKIDKDTADTSAMYGLQIVTGCDIVMAADTAMESGSVGNVQGGHKLTVDAGSVSSVGNDYNFTVPTELDVTKGTVGTVGFASWYAVPVVKVTGGTVGNVYSPDVEIKSENEIPVTVGNVTLTASSGVFKAISDDNYAVKTGTVSATEGSTLTLTGTNTTVGQIDANYNNVNVSLEDFKGTLTAPADAYTEGIDSVSRGITLTTSETDTGDTVATIAGTATVPTMNLNSGTVNFTGALNVGTGGISGAGTLVVVPGEFYTDGSISGISLKLNGSFTVGSTAFKAAEDMVDTNAFTPVGYTLTSTTASSVDTFKVASTVFAGLQVAGPTTITQNTSATYTAAPYPTGTSLPTGYSVEWDLDGNSDSFSYTANGNSVTVKAGSYNTTFASLNKATLVAKVLDASGNEDTDYAEADYAIAMTQSPVTKYTSDTTSAITLKVGQQYTYKITSSDGSDPAFGFGTNGIANIVKTSKATSGTTAFYYYTVQGVKEGATGAFTTADKTKVNVITVKGASYTSDTKAVTIATGKSYTFKITADKGASAPVFQVCTISAKNTVLTNTVKNADGTISYFYKVTANGSPVGAHGAYVNGLNVATVTVK